MHTTSNPSRGSGISANSTLPRRGRRPLRATRSAQFAGLRRRRTRTGSRGSNAGEHERVSVGRATGASLVERAAGAGRHRDRHQCHRASCPDCDHITAGGAAHTDRRELLRAQLVSVWWHGCRPRSPGRRDVGEAARQHALGVFEALSRPLGNPPSAPVEMYPLWRRSRRGRLASLVAGAAETMHMCRLSC